MTRTGAKLHEKLTTHNIYKLLTLPGPACRVVHLHVQVRSEELRPPIIDSFRAWKPPIPYAIKNQRGAKTLVGGFGCEELVLYGIRELA